MSPEPSQRALDLSSKLGLYVWDEAANLIQAALDAERAELEAQCFLLKEGGKAMAALLDRVPHDVALGGWPYTCDPDCPACSWARLKASSE